MEDARQQLDVGLALRRYRFEFAKYGTLRSLVAKTLLRMTIVSFEHWSPRLPRTKKGQDGSSVVWPIHLAGASR